MESTQPLPQKTPKQLTNTKVQADNDASEIQASGKLNSRNDQNDEDEYSEVDEAIEDETPQH